MIISEAVNFFVYTLDLIWWSIGRIYIPGTSFNGQFIFIFTLLITLAWKLVLQRTLPPVKVDNIEIDNKDKIDKRKQTYNRFSKRKKG